MIASSRAVLVSPVFTSSFHFSFSPSFLPPFSSFFLSFSSLLLTPPFLHPFLFPFLPPPPFLFLPSPSSFLFFRLPPSALALPFSPFPPLPFRRGPGQEYARSSLGETIQSLVSFDQSLEIDPLKVQCAHTVFSLPSSLSLFFSSFCPPFPISPLFLQSPLSSFSLILLQIFHEMIENGEVEKPEDANLLLQKVVYLCEREGEGLDRWKREKKEGEQGRRRGKRQSHRESRSPGKIFHA